MSCSKALSFAAPAGAHLSYYWTMNEAGDAFKIDSAAAHAWNTQVGSSSPAALFSNGIQMDCLGGLITPSCHGLFILDDPGLAIDSTTSKGISFWFWAKEVVAGTNPFPFTVNEFEFYFEFYTAGFALDYKLGVIVSLRTGVGNASWNLEHQDFNGPDDFQSTGSFTNTLGSWHMYCGTLDVVNHQLNFYIDGVLMSTVVDTLALSTTTLGIAYLQAFFGPGGIGDTFQAVVDEFGLSLKGALSQSQITALYNGGAGVTWPAVTGIVPYP